MKQLNLHWRDISPHDLNKEVRGVIDEGELAELSESVAQAGILQPLTVIETPGGPTPYQVLTGERRWRAAKALGDQAPMLPCVVRERPATELDALVLMGMENLQRSDLPPVTEARYYQGLIRRGMDVKEIARRLGVKVSRVEGRLKLLDLPAEVQKKMDQGALPITFGNHVNGLPAEVQVELAGKLAGRQARDVKRVATLVKKKLGQKLDRRPQKKDELETLRRLVTQLWTVVAADARLFSELADHLAFYGDDAAAEAFDRAHTLNEALRGARTFRKLQGSKNGAAVNGR